MNQTAEKYQVGQEITFRHHGYGTSGATKGEIYIGKIVGFIVPFGDWLTWIDVKVWIPECSAFSNAINIEKNIQRAIENKLPGSNSPSTLRVLDMVEGNPRTPGHYAPITITEEHII